ncbi:MAG: formate dehydrogenase subunit alpha [Pseudomonadota bacterium]
MNPSIRFQLDGRDVEAAEDETIWQVAKRSGTEIPHLCWLPEPGYRADGNCRACMVEIDGERVLAASCIRKPTNGMVVQTASARATKSRQMVMELLLADQPDQQVAHDRDSRLWQWAQRIEVETSRFPERDQWQPDPSHPAMRVNLDACIQCSLCVRACREVQVNDVIGMANRGHGAKIVFDMDDPMGLSTCVACGECVQACPTGALMPTTLVDEAGIGDRAQDREVESVCPYCGVGCQITYHIQDDRIRYVTGRNGPSNQNRLCVKGRFGFDYVTHPERLTWPLIRKDGIPKHGDQDIDPANPFTHFREASWEEALDRAAAGLIKVRGSHGGRALAGFGSAKCSNEEAYLFQKLVRTAFGSNNVDHCTRLCHASSVAALMEGIGSGAVTAAFNEAEYADVIFVIGANPTENHPVAATYFKQAAKRGAELIVADPRGQALKRHATLMLEFRPGSDVALLNALMHVILEEQLFDRQYIQAHTEGFDQLRAHLADYSPERMAPVCGIDADRLRTVARTYARASAAIIFWGMGISQHVHGTDNARCLISLAMMCGHTGRPGTGLHPLRGQNNVQGASDAGLIPMVFPDYHKVDDPAHRAMLETLWGKSLDDQPGLTVVEIMDAIHDNQIRAMYIMGENPAMSDPNLGHARAAIAKLEHLVVQDIFLTETAKYADVVLPASAWPEKTGTVTNTNRQVQLGQAALPLRGEARPDWWITQELARRLGEPWNYEDPAEIFTEMKQVMPSLENITWSRLEQESSVAYPCPEPDHPGQSIVFSDGFPTESGRAKLVPASVLPPDELPDHEFPLILTTGRTLEHWHTGAITRRASYLDELEPEAFVTMNPADLKKLALEPGEFARIETRRGSIELSTRRDSAIPEGVIFVPFCFAEAAANLLTNPQLDPDGKIPEYKFCAARAMRAHQQAAAE